MAIRAPHLHHALRCFCLAAFAKLAPELGDEGEVPYVLDEHAPGLYEYRPLIRDHIQARAYWLAQLEDARIAAGELRRKPAAAIFARTHAGGSAERALFHAILVPVLVRTAEACGGFDWDESAFERVYADLERSLYGSKRAYSAIAPLVGASVGGTVDLGPGLRAREASAGELTARWSEAHDLLPARFGLDEDRNGVLELERDLDGDASPDAPGELADVVTALRLATGAPVAAGPVVFEQLDRHPFAVRPVLGIAATQPAGEPTRLDPFRGGLARELVERLGAIEADGELAEALERWEVSLFEAEPARSERLRECVAALLGGADGLWAGAMRSSALLGGAPAIAERMRDLARGDRADAATCEAVRHAVVEVVMHGDRPRLLDSLDEALLGLRPRPAAYFSARGGGLVVEKDSGSLKRKGAAQWPRYSSARSAHLLEVHP